MANRRIIKIIPVALTLIIIAVAIAALVSLARVVFFSGDTKTISQTDISREALLSTSIDRAVNMTVRGKIVGDEAFRSYQIQITPTSRKMTVYKGYLDQPINTISLDNNTLAYEQFVYALQRVNFMKGNELTGDNNDLRGVCATGFVYEFQMLKSDKAVKQLWTSSCVGIKGSLDAKLAQLTNLFTAQIPEAKLAIGKIWQ